MLVALTIAGSDSLGGAGIEADIKAMASQGVHGAVAITAVTAQNSCRVADILPLPVSFVLAQIDAVLDDVHVSAAKTGMLYSAEIAAAVASRLASTDFPLVVDPVLVAGVGDALARDGLVEAVREKVIPRATILTPNVLEAEALTGMRIVTDDDVREACLLLADMGAEAVLLKGGHLHGEMSVDTLYHGGKFLRMGTPRVEARGHGGGCILSSFLAANLAKGQGMWEAFLTARTAITGSIAGRYHVGRGVPVVEPMGTVRRDAQRYQVSERLSASCERLVGHIPQSWVPEGGAHVAYALPGAAGPQDVCGVVLPSGGHEAICPRFGTTPRLSAALLAAMSYNGGRRAGMMLRCTADVVRGLEHAGLQVASYKRRVRTKDFVQHERAEMEDVINDLGFVPDIICDRGGPGTEPLVRMFAPSPEELVSRALRALG